MSTVLVAVSASSDGNLWDESHSSGSMGRARWLWRGGGEVRRKNVYTETNEVIGYVFERG